MQLGDKYAVCVCVFVCTVYGCVLCAVCVWLVCMVVCGVLYVCVLCVFK